MKFHFTKEDLEKPLQRLSMIASKSDPILSTLLVESAGSDVSLTATDLMRQIRFNLAGASLDEGRITLPARKFHEIVRTFPSEAPIEVEEMKGADFIRVKSGKSRFKLHSLNPDKFPALDAMEEKPERMQIPVRDFRLLVKGVAASMAKDDVRTYLCGCLFEPLDGCLQVVATDGHRLAKCSIEAPCQSLPSRNFIVPRDAIGDLLGLLSIEKDEERVVEMQFGDRHFGVTIGDYQFLTGLLDGKYPNYERIVPAPTERRVQIDTQEVLDALTRATLLLLGHDEKRLVHFHFSQKGLHITAQNNLNENSDEYIPAHVTGGDCEILFNPDYLRDVLEVSRTGAMNLFILDAGSVVRIDEASTIEKWASTYVVMPVTL